MYGPINLSDAVKPISNGCVAAGFSRREQQRCTDVFKTFSVQALLSCIYKISCSRIWGTVRFLTKARSSLGGRVARIRTFKELGLFWTEATCGAVGGRLKPLKLLLLLLLSAAISLKIVKDSVWLLFDAEGYNMREASEAGLRLTSTRTKQWRGGPYRLGSCLSGGSLASLSSRRRHVSHRSLGSTQPEVTSNDR